MGRGRNKAKQTKVARELKYSAPQTDFEALTRELHSQGTKPVYTNKEQENEEDDVDQQR
jgi:hypothetical protein